MEKVYVGKLVTTHGIKGEVCLSSSFELKNNAFKKGNKVIINNDEYTISNYRVHKKYDMLTFEEINDINQIIPLKGSKVYIDRKLLNMNNDEYLLEDLIGFKVISSFEIGTVTDVVSGINELIMVNDSFYIPVKGDFIKNVDVLNKTINVVDEVKELML